MAASPHFPPLPDEERLKDLFSYVCDTETRTVIAAVRLRYYTLAQSLLKELPESRERSLALTSLEDSCLRAIQCLAVSHGTRQLLGA